MIFGVFRHLAAEPRSESYSTSRQPSPQSSSPSFALFLHTLSSLFWACWSEFHIQWALRTLHIREFFALPTRVQLRYHLAANELQVCVWHQAKQASQSDTCSESTLRNHSRKADDFLRGSWTWDLCLLITHSGAPHSKPELQASHSILWDCACASFLMGLDPMA